MIKREDVYKIGVFNKPHGIHGELSFTFTDDIFDRVEAEYLICLLDGIFVPFFLEEYRFRQLSHFSSLLQLFFLPYQQLLFSSFFLISNGFLSTLTSTGIVLCALTSYWKTNTMTNTTIATDIH